ncbi:recombinase family protein [Streptomyces sp. CG1]|uniref:recombinase family protein n=1 Tax=Streptomyces sp. CG1 TaxID=1287523 RepID=UPI0034E2E8B7
MTHALTPAIQVGNAAVKGAQLRAVDYLRVSTEEQAKGYGIAYTGKKTAQYIQKKGWVHVRTYADEGVSGSLEAHEREDLKQLMQDVRKDPRPFDVVVVAEGRAIGRTGRAFWRWVWELEDLGVYVAVVKGDYDNTTVDGRKKMRKDADYAEEEREVIRDRTQGGVQEKAEEGGYTGGTVPYGWRIQDRGVKGESRLVLDIRRDGESEKGEAITLRRAYALIVDDGLSWTEAAAKLNIEGMLTRSGAPWSSENLKCRLMSRAVLEGVQVFRNADSRDARFGRGVKVDSDGKPLYGATVTIRLDPVLNEKQVEKLKRVAAQIAKRRLPRTGKRVYPLSMRIESLCGSYYVGRVQTSTGERTYVCSGKQAKYAGAPVCTCSQINAEQIEAEVWGRIAKILGDPEELMTLASEWIEVALGGNSAHEDRIEDLDRSIAVQEKAIATVMGTSAKQAAEMGLEGEAAQDLVAAAVKPLAEELARLKKLKAEAVAWQMETLAAEQRARDLRALAELARTEMPNMPPEDQAGVIDLADIRVNIQGPAPVKKAVKECSVGAWFRKSDLRVPVRVTDEEWARIEPLVKKTGRGSGKKTDLPLRDAVGAILWKGRTGQGWSEAAARMQRGAGKSLMSRWSRWTQDGTWGRVVAVLAGAETAPVPDVSNAVGLPDLEISGAVEPRLLLEDSEVHGQVDASSTTMSWQAAMTVSAMPGCPCRRATPGSGF